MDTGFLNQPMAWGLCLGQKDPEGLSCWPLLLNKIEQVVLLTVPFYSAVMHKKTLGYQLHTSSSTIVFHKSVIVTQRSPHFSEYHNIHKGLRLGFYLQYFSSFYKLL